MKTLIMGIISGGFKRFVALDKSTRALIGIGYAHHEIHGRSTYHVSDVQNLSTTTVYWMVTVANNLKLPHMLFNVNCTGEMLVTLTEGADRVGTNLLPSRNRQRHLSDDNSLTKIHRAYSAGSTNGAVTLFTRRAGSTGVASKTVAAGASRGDNEWPLNINTKYILAVTTYADVYVTVAFDWYEHSEKD